MKFLVVGASGLVGWNLLCTATSLGYETVGTYRSHPLPGLIPLQMEDEALVARLLGELRPDVVFCCSGWTWVDGCENDPAKAFRENSEYPARMARCVAEAGSHFVYFSTSYVFDGTAGPYAEEAVPCPISVYGKSKHEGETRVLEATAGRVIIARTMGVYGPEPQQKNFVFQVRKALAAGRLMPVPDDQFGNVTYAPDLARMSIDLARRNQRGIWNLAGPDPCIRRSDFARRIAQCYGLPVDLIEPVKTALLRQPAQRPLKGGLYIEKAMRTTSITPQPWVRIP